MKIATPIACALILATFSPASDNPLCPLDLSTLSDQIGAISPLPSPLDQRIGEEMYALYCLNHNITDLWESLRHGHAQAIQDAYEDHHNFTGRPILPILEHHALRGNTVAQNTLMDAYMKSRFGIQHDGPTNSRFLGMLKGFATQNADLQVMLVSAYMDGDFGIKTSNPTNKRHGRKLALQYAHDNPEVQTLVIRALKTKALGFYSRRSYEPYTLKHHKKLITVTPIREIEFIREYALAGNKDAQLFFICCYWEGKYGADELTLLDFENTIESLLPFADEDRDLQDLILSLYKSNAIRYKNMNRLHEQIRVFRERFDRPDTSEEESSSEETESDFDEGIFTENPFEILTNKTNYDKKRHRS